VRSAPLMPAGPGDRVPGYASKTDLVAALIRELIITGELAAGEQLRQRDLAQRFHVSQTPVREAMRRLESEGLVVGDTHRGFTVVVPDDGPVEENFQIRAALESLGASLAARKIGEEGLARLQALNDRMREMADDDTRYADLNREFHFTVYSCAGSPLLRVGGRVGRHPGRRVPPGRVRHAPVAAAEEPHLRLPAAVVTRELVDEQQRRPGPGALRVERHAVAGHDRGHLRPPPIPASRNS